MLCISLLLFVLVYGMSVVYTDRVSVSVMEGDSVTLHTGVEINQKDRIRWFLKNIRIAQIVGNISTCTDVHCNEGTETFIGRLKLDDKTGSLTITNTRTTDSGLYELQITSSISNTDILKTFNVTVSGAVVSVSVTEGDSVTLHTGVQTNQRDRIRWYYNDTQIAQINGVLSYTCTDVQCNEGTERFRDRLKLDHQTGSLTITNTRTTDSGDYHLQIISRNNEKIFSVAVHDVPAAEQHEMKMVKEGESVTLYPGVVKNPNDVMAWYFEDTLMAEITGDQSQICTDDQCKERFRGRLKLDHQTGSLTITNTRTTDSELFTVKISSSSKQTSYKRFNVSVSEAATEGEALHFSSHVNEEERIGSVLSSGAVAGIVFLLVVVFAAGVFYYCCRISKKRRMVKTVSVMEGVDVTLKTKGAEIQNDDRIMWMHEENCIAERETRETYADGRFRDRLQMDEATGSLTITNIRTTDSGDYTLKIQSNSVVSYKKLHVIVTGSTGIRVNGSVTIEMPLMSREEGNGQPATTSLL